MSKQTISIDFDGVLAQYDGWKGATVIGPPIPGAREFVSVLIQSGNGVVVHSCRAKSPEGKTAMLEWLEENKFPTLRVTAIKPGASVYIDDRALRFEGDFVDMLDQLNKNPWWKEE